MPDAGMVERLRRAVDAGFERQVAFLGELVRFASVRGQEATAAGLDGAAVGGARVQR